MGLERYRVEPVPYDVIKSFVKYHHYSHKTCGLKIYQCFGLYSEGTFGIPQLVGAMIYAKPAMPNPPKKYNPNNPDKCLELVRLVCIDDTPRNTESFFIGKTLKWLKKHTDVEMVISYADANHGHTGVIYKASNFTFEGMTGEKRQVLVDGKPYHERSLTDHSAPIYDVIRERIAKNDPGIQIIRTKPKYIFTYRIR